jgi:trehalose 6-phosphate phosphatase
MCDAQEVKALDPGAALFLDFDGTLVEIAPSPELVRVPRELPPLLEKRQRERGGALAVLSGRPLAELDRLLDPWRGPAAGLHGSERRRADGRIARARNARAAQALSRLRPRLEAFAARDPGLRLEDKGAALALHYRFAPRYEAELRAFAFGLLGEAAGALRVIDGKRVLEFAPAGSSKGTAIAAFLAEPPFRGRPPVFVGDDATDEDGFAAVNRRGGISIRVGPPQETKARFRFPAVAAALAWLGS